MTQEHPITPPPELVHKWIMEATEPSYVPTQAARWGADQELEACVSYVDNSFSGNKARALRALRRSKPPSLKEQSLALIDKIQGNKEMWQTDELDVVRRALESLPD